MAITVLNQGYIEGDTGLPALQQTKTATAIAPFTRTGHRAVAWNEDTGSHMDVVWCLAGEAITAGALCKIRDDYTITETDPNDVGACGVAMAGIASGSYGWVALTGHVRVLAADTAANAQLYLDNAVAGAVDDAAVAGDLVMNAFSLEADVTTSGAYNEATVKAAIHFPFVTNLALVN